MASSRLSSSQQLPRFDAVDWPVWIRSLQSLVNVLGGQDAVLALVNSRAIKGSFSRRTLKDCDYAAVAEGRVYLAVTDFEKLNPLPLDVFQEYLDTQSISSSDLNETSEIRSSVYYLNIKILPSTLCFLKAPEIKDAERKHLLCEGKDLMTFVTAYHSVETTENPGSEQRYGTQ